MGNLAKSALRSAAILFTSSLFVQCATNPSYTKADFEKNKLATPGGHTLSEREYPFDEKGNYRKDWVKNGSTRKRPKKGDATITAPPSLASAPPRPAPAPPRPAPAPPRPAPAPSQQPVYQAPPRQVAPPAPRPTPAPPKPAPAPTAKYHKVSSGDTLYGLSRKYGVSVANLKKTNGLTTDTIRLGQTLRIP